MKISVLKCIICICRLVSIYMFWIEFLLLASTSLEYYEDVNVQHHWFEILCPITTTNYLRGPHHRSFIARNSYLRPSYWPRNCYDESPQKSTKFSEVERFGNPRIFDRIHIVYSVDLYYISKLRLSKNHKRRFKLRNTRQAKPCKPFSGIWEWLSSLRCIPRLSFLRISRRNIYVWVELW